MIVAAHQPAYLPWLGYLAKMQSCDLFVVMDDLQYEPQNFQNRNRVKINHGAHWLVVPLERGPQSGRICDMRIANGGSARQHWQRRAWQTLRIHYGAAPYWSCYAEALHDLHHRPWDSLLALDLYTLSLFACWFEIATPMLLASSLRLAGQRSERIVALCRDVGGDVYLSGRGASTDYLDVSRFAAHGIGVAWQSFRHPIYAQRYPRLGFVSHLSALDLLLNCGPEASPRLLRAAMAAAPVDESVGRCA